MKRVACRAAIAMVFFSLAVPAMAATKVFLLAGQSNMQGVGAWPGGETGRGYYPADAPCPAPYNATQTAVGFWNNNAWVSLQPGFGGIAGVEFGPEVSFGYTLHNAVFPGDDIYLVKYAVSSTGLADSSHQWTPNGSGTTYNTFKSKVNAAMQNLTAAGKSPVISGMIWMQGETDAANGTATASAYGANLANFISKVRSDFAASNMRFVLGEINDYQWGTDANNALVRNAQAAIASQVPNTASFNTDLLERAYWGHYGTQGQIDLGTYFANQFITTPEPPSLIMAVTGLLALTGYFLHKGL
jgi:hypothetical protein